VLRAHVDDDALFMERRRLVGELVPVTADGVEDAGALGGVGVGRGRGVDVVSGAHQL
jgi:hypothetical protein